MTRQASACGMSKSSSDYLGPGDAAGDVAARPPIPTVRDLRAAFAVIDVIVSRMDDFVRSSCDWTWEVDRNFNLVDASSGFTALVGVPPRVLAGRYLLTLGRFKSVEVAIGDLPEFVRQRRPFRDEIFSMRDVRGEMHELRLSGVPFFDDGSDRFLGYRGTAVRITRPSPPLPKPTNGTATASSTGMPAHHRPPVGLSSDVLATVMHELRTPLNAVIGYAELALREPHGAMGDRYKGYVSIILTSARHLLHVIDGMRLAALPESEQALLACEPVSARRLVDEAVAMVVFQARQKGLELRQIADGGDPTIHADPTAVRQILVNLLFNAVKYTPSGGRIGVEIGPEDDRTLGITIFDTGVGIAGDQLDRVFDQFYRVEQAKKDRRPGGWGLGLSIAQRLARAMAGDISVESAPGRGSRFTVRLPLAK
jgi:signal transduction histidine kinase